MTLRLLVYSIVVGGMCVMKRVVWEVQYLSVLPVFRYCKKCREKREFICSGQFRINAQRKSLDIWLIYKCSCCDTTWNATLYSRISPQSLRPEMLEAFHKNDETLAEQFAMNTDLLQKNGAEIGCPLYAINGESFPLNEPAILDIKSKYYSAIKVSSIVREKLHLSQRDYSKLINDGKIKSIPEVDLQKCKLKNGIVLIFQPDT